MSLAESAGINAEVLALRASEKHRLKEIFLQSGRALQPWEILAMEERGNRSDDWSKIRVEEKFRPEAYFSNIFIDENYLSLQQGSVVIQGEEQKCVVENCCFKQCHLEGSVSLRYIDWMERVYVKSEVQLWRISRFEHNDENWIEKMTISVGSEVNGRELEVIPETDPIQAEQRLEQAEGLSSVEIEPMAFSVVSNQVKIENCVKIQNVYLGEATTVCGASELVDVVTLSNSNEKVEIGVGVSIRQAYVQWGCRLDRSAKVEKAILFERSSVDLHGVVIESCLGSNTHVAKGEITASFVGPFVGMHHQSLLIGTLWPEGKGNIGYGANVGSNHTGRAPDQEFWAAEGEFFGLSSSIKFPGYHRDAGYSILATGVTLPPLKLEFPFSLVLQAQSGSDDFPGDLELIPAWMLIHNRYSLVRSSWKIKHRNKSKRYSFNIHYLNPRTVNSLMHALEVLEALPEKLLYGSRDFPLMPGVFLRRERVLEAVEAYREALEYYVGMSGEESPGKVGILDKLNLSQISRERVAELRKKEFDLAVMSLEKDRKRGVQITPEYDKFHPNAELDPCLSELKKSLISS